MRLDEFTQKAVFEPLEMMDTMFLPLDRPIPERIQGRIVPTEPRSAALRGREIMDAFSHLADGASMPAGKPGGEHLSANWTPYDLIQEWNGRHIGEDIPCGVVHDENAAWLWGVAGNAGLFSTARDLAKLGEMYLNGGMYNGKQVLSSAAIRIAGQDYRTPSWNDGAAGLAACSTRRAVGTCSSGSFGHTGFTGTVMWIDPTHEVVVVLLTNRLQFTRANQHILRVRRLLANAVFAEIAKA